MRRLLTGFLAAALCLTLTACWDPEPVSEEQDFWAVTPSEPAQEDTLIRPTAFTLPYINSQTLDPISCSDGVQQAVGSLLYESLFVLDEHFTPRPHLCASYSVSSNGLTYAFSLRDGVTFSDGTSLGAADVFATLRRAQVSERYAARFENVASLRVNRGEVVVTLKQADSALPALLDIPIVKSGSEKDAVPLGTGPYFFMTDSDGPCLMRNDGWWYGGAVFPEMGYLHLDSSKGICVVTPALTRNLSEEGTSCTLTFDAFAIHSSYRTAAKAYRIAILHPDGTVEEESATFSYRFEPLSAPTGANNFAYETSWEQIARKLTLKSGDAVAIINNESYRFMIDNIHIFVD